MPRKINAESHMTATGSFQNSDPFWTNLHGHVILTAQGLTPVALRFCQVHYLVESLPVAVHVDTFLIDVSILGHFELILA